MKRTLIVLLLLLSFLLTGCYGTCLLHVDADHDGLCDACNISMSDSDDIPDAPDTPSDTPDTPDEPDTPSDTPDTPDTPGDTKCEAHSDKNGDTICDLCYESVIIILDIFAINDLHGKVTADNRQPGLSALSHYLENTPKGSHGSLLLSSGDMWQGSAESGLSDGAIITEWMNGVGFDAMTVGNHEYDWGEEFIEDNAELADFPFLAINIYDSATGRRVDYCTPSIIIDLGYVQIGVIGAIGNVYSSIASDYRGGVTFKVGDELTELVKAEADRLRGAGVDYVVYSIHDGYGTSHSSIKSVTDKDISSYYNVELSDGYVDIVFEGHTHQSYVLKDSEGVYHLQGGGENDGISYARISINSVTGESRADTSRIVSNDEYADGESETVNALLVKYEDVISKSNELLGYNSTYRSSTELRELIARLYYEFGEQVWGDEYDLVLGGAFLNARSPYNLYTGEVRYSHLYSIFPFNNRLVLCSISGYDLYYKFLNTSNTSYFIYCGEWGESIKDSIDFNKTYYVITDTYTSTYRYNRLTEIERYSEEIYARDLLAAYISKGGLED